MPCSCIRRTINEGTSPAARKVLADTAEAFNQATTPLVVGGGLALIPSTVIGASAVVPELVGGGEALSFASRITWNFPRLSIFAHDLLAAETGGAPIGLGAAAKYGTGGLFLGKIVEDAEGAASSAGPSTALVPYWPPNNGFLGATTSATLQAGTVLDRFGGSAVSRFFSPAGTPLAARAAPPETAALALRTFRVLQPLTVESGTVAPAFGQLGLGTQYRTTATLGEMLKQGVLEEVH